MTQNQISNPPKPPSRSVINLCEGTYIVRTTDESNGCYVEDTLIVDFYLLDAIVDLEKTT